MRAIQILIVVVPFVLGCGARADDIQPGLWKISLESSVAASPDWRPEPFVLTQCLTESDARDPARLLTGLGGGGVSGCEFFDENRSAGRLSFSIRCGGELGVKGRGEMSFAATRLDGTLDANLGEAEKVDMRNKLHATYLGPCPGAGGGLQGGGGPLETPDADSLTP
jgi:hypothetical protein